jgi:hypothetical protein
MRVIPERVCRQEAGRACVVRTAGKEARLGPMRQEAECAIMMPVVRPTSRTGSSGPTQGSGAAIGLGGVNAISATVSR